MTLLMPTQLSAARVATRLLETDLLLSSSRLGVDVR